MSDQSTQRRPTTVSGLVSGQSETPGRKGESGVFGAYFVGGDEGTRTPDPNTASVVLSQLSYIPMLVPTAVTVGRLIIRDRLPRVKPRDIGWPGEGQRV